MSNLANLKKGDTVILHMFTGIAVGRKTVLAADKNTVTLETRIGMAKFSRKTGKQVEPAAKQERFANYIVEDDGTYVPGTKPAPKAKAKKGKAEEKAVPAKAKAKKKPEPEPEVDEDEYEDADEDEDDED